MSKEPMLPDDEEPGHLNHEPPSAEDGSRNEETSVPEDPAEPAAPAIQGDAIHAQVEGDPQPIREDVKPIEEEDKPAEPAPLVVEENPQPAVQVVPPVPVPAVQPPAPAQPVQAPAVQVPEFNEEEMDSWLKDFYKECGREVTLAYTTLNQMKNWAMLIVAAFISAVVALSKPNPVTPGTTPPPYEVTLPMFIGGVIAFVFTLRFFIRSILCYINLVRWNRLQSDIIESKILQRPPRRDSTLKDKGELLSSLKQDLQDYYHSWLSPIDRKTQLFSNLKLGFALFLALPLFFIVTGFVHLVGNPIVHGLTVFTVGTTLLEFIDFLVSPYFDNPERARRCRRPRSNSLLNPQSRGGYISWWVIVLIISCVVALWPSITEVLRRLFC